MKQLAIILLLASLSACFSLRSPYSRFISNMNTYASYGVTIDKLGDLKFDGRGIAEKKYLTDIEHMGSVYDRFHFKRPGISGGYCYYYFIVNRKTRIAVGWGFDEDRGPSRGECAVSG